MAGTTITRTVTGMSGSDVEALRLEFNKALDDDETLRAAIALLNTKVNAIITAAATNIAAVAAVAALVTTTVDTAADLTAAKIASRSGSTTV